MSGKEIRTLSTHGNSCLLTYTIVLVGCQNQEVIWIYGFKIHRGSIVCFKLFWQWSSSHNIPIALCEDKLEFGHGGSDPYMQIARCYNLVVGVLTDHSTKNINASNFLTHGAPCFLICPIGTQCCSLVLASVDLILPRVHVVICGGFLDGHKPVVEPLGQPVFMLADHICTHQGEVARLLGALVRGISSLRWWGHDGNLFRHLPLKERCLQARDSTFWNLIYTIDPSHLQVMHITRTRRRRGDSDICVPAQRCVPATISCYPLVSFHSRPSSPCQTCASLLFTRCPQAYGR